MSKYRCTYEYTVRHGWPFHVWTLVGARGGIHLHISDRGEKDEYGRYSGGIEIHHRSPPEYMQDQPPSHDECHVLKAPCWHDGSSLQASERWIPAWLADPHDHDRMFRLLAVDADHHFKHEESEEGVVS